MTRNTVCRFNQFGYCKFGNSCFRKHVNSICENVRCFKPDCELRHPKKCRYFFQFSYCKFGDYCRFKHEEIRNDGIDKEIEKLRLEIDKLGKVIETKENEIKNKDIEIRKLLLADTGKLKKKVEDYESRNEALELENKQLKDTIDEVKKEQERLRNDKAEEFMLFLDFKERMKLKYLYDSDDEESDYESDDEKREKSRELFRKKKQEERNMKNKCEKCDFIGKTPAGLKTHIRKKH